MNKRYILFVLTMLFSGMVFSQELVILHLNDFHSQIETMRTGYGAGAGGAHRISEYVEKVREENKNVLLLDAGDYNQGTPYFNLFKGNLEIKLMNTLKVNVACLGNHEFDNGVDELARRLKKAKFKTVCANYDFSGTPLEKLVKPYVVKKIGGIKVGIIGLLTDIGSLVMKETSSAIKYKDMVKTANKYASFLKEEKGCDLVIALTHIGYKNDKYLIENTENIDIVVGGHSHTFLKSAQEVENKDGDAVILVHAGAKGEYVGRLDISFD